MTTHTQQALLLIDLQNDFCADGALAVTDGDSTLPVANHYAREFAARGQPVLVTQDWHPADHGSFASQAGTAPFTRENWMVYRRSGGRITAYKIRRALSCIRCLISR